MNLLQSIIIAILTSFLTIATLVIGGILPMWLIFLPIGIPLSIVALFYSFIVVMYCMGHPHEKFDWQSPWNNQITFWWFVEYHGMKWRGELDKEE